MITFWTVFTACIILIVVLATIYGIFLWIQRRRHTRERFAFVSLAAVVGMASMLIVALSKNIMPWDAVAILLKHFFAIDITIAKPTMIDYGFLMAIYLIATYCIIQLHKNWGDSGGLQSIDQYRREQRSEPSGVFTEGVYEIRRIAQRQPVPLPYVSPDPRDFLAQLEPVRDSLAWKDQARELIRLSSPSYAFDAETGWHDLASVWVGKNLDTNELAFLRPASEAPHEGEVKVLVDLAQQIAASKGSAAGLIIVAVRGDEAIPQINLPPNVRMLTEASLLDGLVNWNDYVNEIRKRVTVNYLPDSELTLQDVYVPPKCALEGDDSVPIESQTILAEWILERSQKQIALLGGYGQGKSTTALLFTYHTLSRKESRARIPLLIELRGTSPRNLTPLQLLGAWSAQYNINPQALLRLLIAGRLILIFEGFDEMALVGDAEMRLKHFRTLWQFCYPNSKIMITGRPNFFLDETEMKSALGIYKPISGKAYCQALRLVPFDLEQIALSLREHKESVRSQICSLVTNNSRFRELVSRPSLLHIVSVLWEREELSSKVDRLDSAFIMDLFVRHSYRRQGRKEADSPEFMALTGSEREYFMQGIAAYMAAQRLPNQIASSQLGQLVETLIAAAPDSLSEDASTILGEIRNPLKQRLQGSEDGVDHVKTDVRACGLLVDDPAAPGTFRFGHKSFMEFLFAAVLADLINTERERSRAILKATNSGISDLDHLPVSVDFLAEMLAGGQEFGDEGGSAARASESPQRKAAERLIEVVLGGSEFVRYLKRIGVFLDCLGRSSSAFLPLKGPVSRRLLGQAFPMMIAMTVAIAFGTMFDVAEGRETRGFVYSVMVWVLMLFPILMSGGSLLSDRLRLWNVLCKEMNVADEIMHRVVGTWYIPWARNRVFDYYLTENSLLDIQRREGATLSK